jgi:hypothetical protein
MGSADKLMAPLLDVVSTRRVFGGDVSFAEVLLDLCCGKEHSSPPLDEGDLAPVPEIVDLPRGPPG